MIHSLISAYRRRKAAQNYDEVAPEGWVVMVGRDGTPLNIPADLAHEAELAEHIDAATVYDKTLVWHGDYVFTLDMDQLRNIIYIAHHTEDGDMALIEVLVNLVKFADMVPEDDEDIDEAGD